MGLTGFILFVILTVSTLAAAQEASVGEGKGGVIENPTLVKLPFSFPVGMENTPVVYEGRALLVNNSRPVKSTAKDMYLFIEDLTTGEEVTRFGQGFSFVSAIVVGKEMNVFATQYGDTEAEWTKDIYRFWSTDLKTWKSELVLTRKGGEHFFNTSVCRDDHGYVMAYESNKPVQWCFRFARSKDLSRWEPIEGISFADLEGRTACGNPTLRYFAPYYYMIYGAWRYKGPGLSYEYRLASTKYVTLIARSKDLALWELSPTRYPMLDPGAGEGINNTDADLFECEGNTYVYYATGDQQTWGTIRVAMHPGAMKAFLESYFPEGAPMIRFDAKQGRYLPKGDANGAVDANMAKRQEWFRQAKFGYIVHYSLFSLAPHEGLNPLELNLRMRNGAYPLPEYERFADRFKAGKFDAATLVARLKAAGGRYMIFITKEHDGFCLFDTKLTDYNAVKHGAGRDLIGELIKAARADEMKLCLYYSMLDEHHPDYRANLPQYVNYMHGQIRELCSNYGPIDGIWFDGEWDHPIEAWRSPELVEAIRRPQPNAVVNDRLGKGLRGKTRLCDFYTREQLHEIHQTTDFERDRPYPWEACMTIGESWVYSKSDTKLKPSEELIRRIVDVASRGGNLVLNVPLTGDGEIPGEYDSRLRDIGEWMSRCGESIHGTYGSPFASLPAGKCTTKGNRLYVHLESHPGPAVRLPGLQNGIKRAWFLKTGETLEFDDVAKTVAIPAALPDKFVSTVAIELDSRPMVK
ncbi:MAG: alpha-L-fucosidase [Phycisphaerae bacterium]|nr:alpha-L-fucosidase [Phycisphaerae bacterium]